MKWLQAFLCAVRFKFVLSNWLCSTRLASFITYLVQVQLTYHSVSLKTESKQTKLCTIETIMQLFLIRFCVWYRFMSIAHIQNPRSNVKASDLESERRRMTMPQNKLKSTVVHDKKHLLTLPAIPQVYVCVFSTWFQPMLRQDYRSIFMEFPPPFICE